MKEKSQMIEKLELALEKQQDGMTNTLFDAWYDVVLIFR